MSTSTRCTVRGHGEPAATAVPSRLFAKISGRWQLHAMQARPYWARASLPLTAPLAGTLSGPARFRQTTGADVFARRYTWMTYGEAAADRVAISSGLVRLGVRSGQRVGLYSVNCAEWVLTEGALTRLSCVSVPLYDTLGPKAVEYICNHAELVAVACHHAVLATLLESLPACPSIKLVVVFGGSAAAARPYPRVPGVTVRQWALTHTRMADDLRWQVVSLDAVRAAGRASPIAPTPPSLNDVATICYTSGLPCRARHRADSLILLPRRHNGQPEGRGANGMPPTLFLLARSSNAQSRST